MRLFLNFIATLALIALAVCCFLMHQLISDYLNSQSNPSDDPSSPCNCATDKILYTVTDQNILTTVDIDNSCLATSVGSTQDQSGLVRRIRGLAYDPVNDVMYGMTREGDLVEVDYTTGQTTYVGSLSAVADPFWSGLAFDGTDTTALKLYTATSFANHELAEIALPIISPAIGAFNGSTNLATGTAIQILGLDIYPASAPAVPPTASAFPLPDLYASNRTNDNISEVSKSSAIVSYPFGNHTSGVTNHQAITFHPDTGVLFGIHDHGTTGNNSVLSTYNFASETTTEFCELSFGIVESVGGGNDTYGWGGLTFGPK